MVASLEEGTPAEREVVLALAPLVLHVLARGDHAQRDALERAIEESTREEMPEDPEEMSDELFFELEVPLRRARRRVSRATLCEHHAARMLRRGFRRRGG